MKSSSRRKGTVEHGEGFGWWSCKTVTRDINYSKVEGQELTIIYIASRVAYALLDFVRRDRVVATVFRPGRLNVSHHMSDNASCASW